MKFCNKCNMKIVGNRANCPLCNNVLSGEGDENSEVFPQIYTIYSQYYLIFKFLLAISISGGLISLLINHLITGRLTWSVIVIAGIACMWISLLLIINKRKNLAKCVMYQVIVASLLVIPWDYLTGWHGWSIDFVMPILYVGLMLALIVITFVSKQRLEDQLWYLFIASLFGQVQLYFVLAHKIKYMIPSYVCIIVSILALSFMLSFRGREIVSEIKRRIHI